jgi:hypothetical protein
VPGQSHIATARTLRVPGFGPIALLYPADMPDLDRRRRLDALRRLAERPGTPAEGEAAQAATARLRASNEPQQPSQPSPHLLDVLIGLRIQLERTPDKLRLCCRQGCIAVLDLEDLLPDDVPTYTLRDAGRPGSSPPATARAAGGIPGTPAPSTSSTTCGLISSAASISSASAARSLVAASLSSTPASRRHAAWCATAAAGTSATCTTAPPTICAPGSSKAGRACRSCAMPRSCGNPKAEGIYAGKGRPAKIDVTKVREMKAQGRGATEIAEQLGVGRASVYRVLGEAP